MDVLIISPTRVMFEGRCKSIILPGEYGIFEVLPFHKKLESLLKEGEIDVDGQLFPILRGIVKVCSDKITAVVEEKIGHGDES